MRHVWSALCTRAIIDQETRMVSLIDLCDVIEVDARELERADAEISISEKDIHHLGPVTLYFMTMWYRTTGKKREEGEFRVFVETPKGTRIRQPPRPVVFEDNKAAHAGIKFNGFPYDGRGIYQVGVESRNTSSSRWTTIARHPLEIRAKELPAQKASLQTETAGRPIKKKESPSKKKQPK